MPLPKDPARRKKVAKFVVSLMKLKPLIRVALVKQAQARRKLPATGSQLAAR
jgi:hypothetical protein